MRGEAAAQPDEGRADTGTELHYLDDEQIAVSWLMQLEELESTVTVLHTQGVKVPVAVVVDCEDHTSLELC